MTGTANRHRGRDLLGAPLTRATFAPGLLRDSPASRVWGRRNLWGRSVAQYGNQGEEWGSVTLPQTAYLGAREQRPTTARCRSWSGPRSHPPGTG